MLTKEKLAELLFPHEEVRKIQDELILDVEKAVKSQSCLIMHAPTGLGKTASTLPIALSHAIDNNLTVLFLTSRHTQHKIAIDTLKEIKIKHQKEFLVSDLIGKRWMCSQPSASIMRSQDFHAFCKGLVEDKKCEFYNKTYNDSHQLSVRAKKVMSDIKNASPIDIDQIISMSSSLCPYEIAIKLSAKAQVIIADYNYVFNPSIQETFFKKIGITLDQSIIIVDEAHNLPIRVRDSMTQQISTFSLKRAIKDARENEYSETSLVLEKILELIETLSIGGEEKLIEKQKFIELVGTIDGYDKIVADLKFIADNIVEEKQTSLLTVARFLETWKGEDESFARIVSRKTFNDKLTVTLSYRCLDPSIITQPIFSRAYSTILMSGTLTPVEMFSDLLGLGEHEKRTYQNPFPEKNKLSMIVPETTTKFTARNEEQFKKIAQITSNIVNQIPGNSIIFFPSYSLRDKINPYFSHLCNKTVMMEIPNLTKLEKTELLDEFKTYKNSGAVLLAVNSGSFGEGVDLPGDLLKGVINVGLPLGKPDLETKELIKYYDTKYGKGWDYGYILPAISKCKQSAGRCIRSATDRGVIVYLDLRFTWPSYFKCFSEESNLLVTKDYIEKIEEFFE